MGEKVREGINDTENSIWIIETLEKRFEVFCDMLFTEKVGKAAELCGKMYKKLSSPVARRTRAQGNFRSGQPTGRTGGRDSGLEPL